jgi:hypothetical protein
MPDAQRLEPRMGVDLGDVRVHQDRGAHETADAINARAFTHGRTSGSGAINRNPTPR